MRPDNEAYQQKLADCLKLFVKYDGKQHRQIEAEMRDLGYTDFSRRSLYPRYERGRKTPGWIEAHGWLEKLKTQDAAAKPATSKREPRGGWREFKNWLKSVSPNRTWDAKHQQYIFERLHKITTGENKRLMIFLPPRHGKSEMVTVRYSAWRLKQDPKLNIILGSYNQHLANRFSRMTRNVLYDDQWIERNADIGVRPDGDAEAVNSEQRIVNSDKTKNPSPISANSKNSTTSTNSPEDSTNSKNYRLRHRNSESEWETPQGGGIRAVGVGAGVTGYGASLIIVDDPVKNREQAESKTYREKVWDWFNDDLYTRLEPEGAMILIQTRWHEDDLAGRLIREMNEDPDAEKWDIIDLPAIAEPPQPRRDPKLDILDAMPEPVEQVRPTIYIIQDGRRVPVHSLGGYKPGCAPVRPPQVASPEPAITKAVEYRNYRDCIGRGIGEPLWPERFGLAKLTTIKKKLGPYSFASLYQQRPVPAEGGLFKRSWFKSVPAAPPGLKWKRGWDLGISSGPNADYTATAKVAYDAAGNLYVDSVFRARIEYPDQRKRIVAHLLGEPNIEQGIELAANGNAVMQDLRSDARHRASLLRGVKVDGNKISRALGWMALAEEGRVHLVRGHWNNDFIEEACSFPLGTHDDQIDAVSIGVHMHAQRVGKFYAF